MLLDSSDRGFACHVMLDGYWEMWMTQYLARVVRPGMTVVDVGANFGYFTLLLGEAVGERGHVLAVEPNPRTAHYLRQTIDLNGFSDRTFLLNEALAAARGRGWLFSPTGEPKNASLVVDNARSGGETFEVPVASLDDIALERGRVDLIKIDAEGAELGIFSGMKRLVDRDHPLLVIEFNAARYADPGSFLHELMASYPVCRELTFEGELAPVRPEDVLRERYGQDRMLVLE
jgi:FkbM family methyltransferase